MAKRIINFMMWIGGFLLVLAFLSFLFMKTRDLGYRIFSNKAKDTPEHAVESAVTIRKNESLLEIGRDLKNKSIVDNAYIFAVSAWTIDDHDRITPGEYNISSDQKPSELVEIFTGESEEDESIR